MDDPHSIDHVTCVYTLRCSFLDTNTMFPPRRSFDHPIASGDRNAGRRLIRRLIRAFTRATIQLKPHFLPRLIIDSPTPSSFSRARRNHLKTQQNGPIRFILLTLSPTGLLIRGTLGIRIGLNKGYETTAIPKRVKPSHLKGRLSKKTQFVRSVVREVVGFAPYERRVLELLRNSKVSALQLPTATPDLRSLMHSSCTG